jgi:hypothetical protein
MHPSILRPLYLQLRRCGHDGSSSRPAPGVIHRWTNLRGYADEVAAARIYAGFHYRFWTIVGRSAEVG